MLQALIITCAILSAVAGKKASAMGEVALHKRGPLAWSNHDVDPLPPLQQNGWTRLLSHAVADDTAKQWIPKVKAFLQWCSASGLLLVTCSDYDQALAQYFDTMCYHHRLQPSEGSIVMFGFLCLVPEFSGRLFLASRSLKSWRKLSVSSEGGPLCEEALVLIAVFLFANGFLQEAAWILVQYDAYGREQDVEQLAPDDILRSR